MKILGIETSCDETAVSIVEYDDGRFSVLESVVASQISEHQKYGGVVPEVAARLHVPVLPKMIEAITFFNKGDIDAVAVTAGPGLSTALRVGIESAKALAVSWGVPLIPVDHIEGHIFANMLDVESAVKLPALCLIVSGGHTELVLMREYGEYEFLGSTRDDAAGEAFDKTAAQLGLPYPGGPSISKEAEDGDAVAYDLPRPMLNSGDLDMSFSGLKTAVRNLIQDKKGESGDGFVADVSASFQQAVVDVLIAKTLRAADDHAIESVLLCGGVAANKELRRQLKRAFAQSDIEVHVPEMKYATDNAAMIAAAGAWRLHAGDFMEDPFVMDAHPGHKIGASWKWED